jgi:hypothetical protein
MLGEIYYKNKFLSEEDCNLLINHFNENRENAFRSRIGFAPSKVDLTSRISKTLYVDCTDPKFTQIFDEITDVAKHMNDELFLFDIDWNQSKQNKNTFVINEYDGTEKAFRSKHQNVNWIGNNLQRKLCASIVLSETTKYEGGDVVMYFGTSTEMPKPMELRTQGILYIYPAFRYTEIFPVLSGHKYHLDMYWEGPHWR